ncbi:hypothetical protein FYJ58_13230 [Lachnospiraceae bacterium WCA-693-APC-MOT-I]|uniref:Wadjet protein JetD C-terminal domain-containing protein n=1 Tax=Velocimicrobium porci TaxID=2606634 RepID=A0A6L5Y1N1_9FIRM|nr:hypothetical protein [Velocimicrobium porci]
MNREEFALEQIFKYNKKKITLDEIRNLYDLRIDQYMELYDIINELMENNKISIIKSSKLNGRTPPLYNRYKINFPEQSFEQYKEELNFKMVPELEITYYLNHIEQYKLDREKILQLNQFLLEKRELLDTMVSLNERSFQIWNYEKEISEKSGKRILKNLGLTLEDLNLYETTEPLAYYSVCYEAPQNIIIVENKDTFFSMRKYLLEGNNKIFGVEIGTIVYGAGKRIWKNFMDFFICAPPYLSAKQNQILYFGDLDYEGIIIYEKFYEMYHMKCKIKIFKEAYLAMLVKREKLPSTKEKQNTSIGTLFLEQFKEAEQNLICQILKQGIYIPQEILNVSDF